MWKVTSSIAQECEEPKRGLWLCVTRWQDQEASVGRGDGEGAIHHCYMRHTLPACLLHCFPLGCSLLSTALNFTVLFMPPRKKYSKTWTNEAIVAIYSEQQKKVVKQHVALCTYHASSHCKFGAKTSRWQCASQGMYPSSEMEQRPLSRATEIPGICRERCNTFIVAALPNPLNWVARGFSKICSEASLVTRSLSALLSRLLSEQPATWELLYRNSYLIEEKLNNT